MVNADILKGNFYLEIAARKVIELFDKYEGTIKKIDENPSFRYPYENLRKKGVIYGHDTIPVNVEELRKVLAL